MRLAALAITVLGLAAAAYAEEDIVLIDGSVLKGNIDRVEADKIVVRDSASGALLEIPMRYLSPFQQYRARSWNVKPEDMTPETHKQRLNWCLDLARYDVRLTAAAEAEARMALSKGVDKAEIDRIIGPFGYMINDKGEMKSPEQMGLVWDDVEKEWVKPEVLDERQKARKSAMAADLKKKLIIGNPMTYDRVSPLAINEARADFPKRKVRFWGSFQGRREGFGFVKLMGGTTVAEEKYVGIVLRGEDFAYAFVEKANRKVLDKLDVIQRGERIQVFGTVALTEAGFVLLLDDLISD